MTLSPAWNSRGGADRQVAGDATAEADRDLRSRVRHEGRRGDERGGRAAGTGASAVDPRAMPATTTTAGIKCFRRIVSPLLDVPVGGATLPVPYPRHAPRQNAEKGPRRAPSLRLPLDELGGDTSQCALGGRADCVRDRSLQTDALDGIHRSGSPLVPPPTAVSCVAVMELSVVGFWARRIAALPA